ncbi:MAG: signal peptidase I [Chloroflexi bacterium OLB14]|nr:MAG: signal peptidase I [Chloroflexi bacterium OLB14]
MDPLNQNIQAGQVEPAEENINWKPFVTDLVQTLVMALILFVGINAISARVRVDGYSMRPTLEDGEFVLVNKLSYRWSEVERGDIIVFDFPLNMDEELIKRVIGLPGDQIVVQDGQVFVNGQLLNEPYIADVPNYSGEWLVADGTIFVLGDNRNNSNDSKDWGLLPIENIVGKASVIYWPPPMWNVIEHTDIFATQ